MHTQGEVRRQRVQDPSPACQQKIARLRCDKLSLNCKPGLFLIVGGKKIRAGLLLGQILVLELSGG